jgi:hypothetical protein
MADNARHEVDPGRSRLRADGDHRLFDVLQGDSTIDIETIHLTLTAADGTGVSLRTNL